MANPFFFRKLPEPIKNPLRQIRNWLSTKSNNPHNSCSPVIEKEIVLESLPNVPDLFCQYRQLLTYPEIERKPGGFFYRGKFYPDYLHVGGASFGILREAKKYCWGVGIDIGAGYWPYPGAIPVDLFRGPGYGKVVQDFNDNSLDYVFSSHCLEHIENWKPVLKSWIIKIKVGGILLLYLPHPDCEIWHPGSPFVGDGHKWIPFPENIRKELKEIGCDILAYDDGPDTMMSFFVCSRKL